MLYKFKIKYFIKNILTKDILIKENMVNRHLKRTYCVQHVLTAV